MVTGRPALTLFITRIMSLHINRLQYDMFNSSWHQDLHDRSRAFVLYEQDSYAATFKLKEILITTIKILNLYLYQMSNTVVNISCT